MKYSVIIPCHNAGALLNAALSSVAGQSLQPFEVVIVDDRSTDGAVDAAAGSFPGLSIKTLRVDEGNAAAARNAGISHATGDWLAFLDADNVWFPDHLEQAASTLHGSADLAYMAYPGRDEDGAARRPAGPAPIPTRTSGLTHHDFLAFRKDSFGFPTTGQVLRKTVVEEAGGFDVSQIRRHDFELFMRVVHQRTWSFNPGPTWWSRPTRPGNISSHEVECRYYALRALVLNRGRYEGRIFDETICRAARAAIKAALLQGTTDDFDRAWELGRNGLSPAPRIFLQCTMPFLRLARRFSNP